MSALSLLTIVFSSLSHSTGTVYLPAAWPVHVIRRSQAVCHHKQRAMMHVLPAVRLKQPGACKTNFACVHAFLAQIDIQTWCAPNHLRMGPRPCVASPPATRTKRVASLVVQVAHGPHAVDGVRHASLGRKGAKACTSNSSEGQHQTPAHILSYVQTRVVSQKS